jgi:MFS family permease
MANPMPNPCKTLAIASVAVFLVLLDTTIMFVAFRSLQQAFPQVLGEQLSWVLKAYTIVYAALLVPSGRLADLYGRKRVLLTGVAVFTMASALCGMARDPAVLIAFRVLQSLGAAALTPSSLALCLAAFPLEKRAVAVSIWGAVGALAAAVGPSLGAVVIDNAGWPWAFFVNVPVGLIAFLVGAKQLAESQSNESGALPDVPGILMLIVAVGAMALGVVQSGSWGWTASSVWMAVGLAMLSVFVVWAQIAKAPALDLSLFKERNYRYANVASRPCRVTAGGGHARETTSP